MKLSKTCFFVGIASLALATLYFSCMRLRVEKGALFDRIVAEFSRNKNHPHYARITNAIYRINARGIWMDEVLYSSNSEWAVLADARLKDSYIRAYRLARGRSLTYHVLCARMVGHFHDASLADDWLEDLDNAIVGNRISSRFYYGKGDAYMPIVYKAVGLALRDALDIEAPPKEAMICTDLTGAKTMNEYLAWRARAAAAAERKHVHVRRCRFDLVQIFEKQRQWGPLPEAEEKRLSRGLPLWSEP